MQKRVKTPLGPFWRLIVSLCHIMTLFSCLALGVSILIVCADVAMRTIGHPFQGTYDIVRITSAITIACALPLTTAVKGHVAIEYFFRKLNRTGRWIVDSLMRVLMIAGFLFATVACISHGNRFLQSNQVTDTIELPMFWVPWLMAAAFILTATVVCYHLLNPGKELIRS